MREILFRGKRVDNGKWVYGYYIKATRHWHERGVHEDWIATDTIQNGGWCNVREKYAVIPETVVQYTGLTDKNGKKIFEGDIVKNDWCFAHGNSVVKFGQYKPLDMSNDYQQGHLGFYLEHIHKADKGSMRKDIMYFANSCEIVGNIHDNKLEDFQNGC